MSYTNWLEFINRIGRLEQLYGRLRVLNEIEADNRMVEMLQKELAQRHVA